MVQSRGAWSVLLVASLLPRQASGRAGLQGGTLDLLKGSLSGRKLDRRAPWMANLHRATDGTLLGLGICMLAMSGLTLHWQNHWGESYQQLEASQMLAHRMQESAALLEQHHLGALKKPGLLVPTSSEKLIYLAAPHTPRPANATELLGSLQIGMGTLSQIRPGY